MIMVSVPKDTFEYALEKARLILMRDLSTTELLDAAWELSQSITQMDREKIETL